MLKGRRFIYLRKAASPTDGGGIYDNKVCFGLRELGAEVAEYPVKPAGTREALANCARTGLLPEMARYVAQLEELDLSSYSDWELIVSHEGLFPAIEAFPQFQGRTWIIIHNLRGNILDRGGFSFLRATKTLARYWDRRYLRANAQATLVCLSQREVDLLQSVGFDKLRLLRPGAPVSDVPPPTRLTPTPSLVISGSYDWRLKRRDALYLANKLKHELATGNWTGYADTFFMQEGLNVNSINAMPSDSHVRLGLVPDRFIVGMKLKVIWYIANNCVVASHVGKDLLPEFRGISMAEKFIRTVNFEQDLRGQLKEIWADIDVNAFREFRAECLRRFNWREQIAATFA